MVKNNILITLFPEIEVQRNDDQLNKEKAEVSLKKIKQVVWTIDSCLRLTSRVVLDHPAHRINFIGDGKPHFSTISKHNTSILLISSHTDYMIIVYMNRASHFKCTYDRILKRSGPSNKEYKDEMEWSIVQHRDNIIVYCYGQKNEWSNDIIVSVFKISN